MNYYPFHIGDYISATRHLSWEEDAAYRRLLDVYYATEKPLPLDHKQACRLVLATTDAERAAVQTVLDEFFTRTDDGWINGRADAEIAAMREKQQKQRDKAKRRWQKPEPEPGIAAAMPRHAKDDAAAMPPTPTPTPTPIQEEEDLAPTVHSLLAAPKRPAIPVQAIIDSYHELLPMCPQVRKLTEARRRQIEARWRAGDLPDVETWREYFEFCAKSKFLTGTAPALPGQRPFVADLEWLSREGNYAKVYERKYHR